MAANNTYQVILNINGINTPVNVFGNSSADAANNARYQVNPTNPSSIGVVSVNAINTCAAPTTVVTGRAYSVGVQGSSNINNY